jgi:ketosteroid isomerase-like protein
MLRPLAVSSIAVVLVILTFGAQIPSVNDDAAVRAALKEYLATVTWPDPEPIDPRLFAADIEAFWSNGKTYHGREAVAKAMREGVDELKADFESFGAKAEDVKVHCKGDFAWVACRIEMKGTLTEDRGTFHRTIRSTFVFEKRSDRWQMVHEHSSRLPAQGDQTGTLSVRMRQRTRPEVPINLPRAV